MSIDPATLCDLLWSPDKVGLYQDTGATTPSAANGDNVKLRQDQSVSVNDFTEEDNPPTLLDYDTWFACLHVQAFLNRLANAGTDFDFEINQPFSFICEAEVSNSAADNALAGNFTVGGGLVGWYVFVGNSSQVYFGIHGTSGAAVVYTDADTIPSATKKIVAVRYDGSESAAGISIFINGVLQSLTVLSDALAGTSVTGAPCYLGAREDIYLGGEQSHPGISSAALTDEEIIGMSDWLAELTGIYTPAGGGSSAPQAMQNYRRRRVA